MPEISIITPIFADKEEKVDWLIEMIESLKSQTFVDWECVVVDDFSPVRLDRAKSETDERFRWFRTTRNSGPSLCRNVGVALGIAEGILPLDYDDALGEPNTLQLMYDAWDEDRKKVIYGDLQHLIRVERGKPEFRKGRIFTLPEYSFQRAMEPMGIMPVTSLHSREAHDESGGWKSSMEFGFEDVEYLLNLGVRGYCGKRIPSVTLLYRKYEDSRHKKLSNDKTQYEGMISRIKELHLDIFEGRFPVGCCGGRGVSPRSSSNSGSRSVISAAKITTNNPGLDQYPANEKEWVQYKGKAQGTFGVRGQFTDISYQVQGPGHKFQAHINDLPKFRRLGRGQHFDVGVAPPIDVVPSEPQVEPELIAPESPPVELAEVERFDRIAAEARGLELVKVPVVETVLPPEIEEIEIPKPPTFSLDDLNLGTLQASLEMESWTVELLAESEISDLTPYKGIGPKRAENIIKSAQELIGGTS